MCLVAICPISCKETKKARPATAGIEDSFGYDMDTVSVEESFFFPEEDIRNTELVRKVQLRYNYANVLYRILHGYELFCRKSSDDSLGTRLDSISVIAQDCPVIPSSFLKRAIPDKNARNRAEKMLAAYATFDGDEFGESDFNRAYAVFHDGNDDLPGIVEKSLLADFEEHFWEWYDKRRYVPEYDRIARLYLESEDSGGAYPEEQIDHLRSVLVEEKEINRLTILALELMRLGQREEATIYLGEILESGVYTKYLLEAWIAWRADVQLTLISPSSFAVSPSVSGFFVFLHITSSADPNHVPIR